MIVVFDASMFVSTALKANSLPERALLRAVTGPNRLLLSQAIEDEYREVFFRPKFDRFVAVERRQRILDLVVFAADRVEPTDGRGYEIALSQRCDSLLTFADPLGNQLSTSWSRRSRYLVPPARQILSLHSDQRMGKGRTVALPRNHCEEAADHRRLFLCARLLAYRAPMTAHQAAE